MAAGSPDEIRHETGGIVLANPDQPLRLQRFGQTRTAPDLLFDTQDLVPLCHALRLRERSHCELPRIPAYGKVSDSHVLSFT
jgi:hypothetical protein